MSRYAINDASADWSMAEAQVARVAGAGAGGGGASGKSTVVSVKGAAPTAQKRKAGDDASHASKGGEKKAGARRSIKKARR